MSRFALCFLAVLPLAVRADEPRGPVVAGQSTPLRPLVGGLKDPRSVAVGVDGRIHVSTADGIVAVRNSKAVPFARGVSDPRGLASAFGFLFAVDGNRVLRIDRTGKVAVHVEARAFPKPPRALRDIEADTQGNLYVCDTEGAVYRIFPFSKKVVTLTDREKNKALQTPRALLMSSEYHLFVLDSGSGKLLRARIDNGQAIELAGGFAGGAGLARDHHGRLYVSEQAGKLHVIGRPGRKAVLLASGFQSAGDVCLSADGKSILVSDPRAGALYAVPCTVPGAEVDERPLPVKVETAFADLQWTGWTGRNERGKEIPLRPILLTHAGDGSDRVFVPTQQGVIHVFPNDPKAKKTKIFLDLHKQVRYSDAENEEGFLGMTFAPDYRKTGVFYVFYTRERLVNHLSRFRVSKDDPDRADPASEEVLLKIRRPFWNHDGGTICFGPDGYLYVTLGDGGAANDPFGNGQKLGSLLGKVLRLDVSRKGEGLPYAIPKDNPFVKTPDARPEVWAYGLRNIWRMSFDRKTGRLWAADVGQNLWEEIDLIEKGGNFGWNRREGQHPFGFAGVEPNARMIEPIWEYHHDVGKSITGGHVYRGRRVPALEGLYLYADYVTGHVWGLKYDEGKKRVTANHLLRRGGFPVYSFGEDEKGEVYFLTSTVSGKGISRFAPAK